MYHVWNRQDYTEEDSLTHADISLPSSLHEVWRAVDDREGAAEATGSSTTDISTQNENQNDSGCIHGLDSSMLTQ